MSAVTGIGVYTPRWRIEAAAFEEAWGRQDAAGVSQKAVPGPDEDALTMAVEAGRRALSAADRSGSDIDWLALASANLPVAEEDLTARVGAMLAIPEACQRRTVTGSTRAGTQALRDGATSVAEGRSCALVLVGDAPVGETHDGVDHAAGAGAAAFVIEPDGPLAVTDSAEYATVAPGVRFRERGADRTTGLGITQYDRTVFLEALGGALEGLEEPVDPDAVAVQSPDGKLPYRASALSGVDVDTIQAAAVVHQLGDLGAASVPVAIASAIRDGHTSVLGLGYGGGVGADALVLEGEGAPVSGRLEGSATVTYSEYLRLRGEVTGDLPDGGGAYVSMPTWRRSIPQRYRLEAGRCHACGELAFPPEGACPDCGRLEGYEPTPLPGTGTVRAVTTISQGGAPPEFAPYQDRVGSFPAAIVAFDGPDECDTVSVPVMVTDADAEDVTVDTAVAGRIRRLYTQEGVTRYGLKVVVRPDQV